MAGNRREYTIKAGQSVSDGLQFTAASVIIDNPNSYYVYLSYIRRWVPPFTMGTVLRYGVNPSVAAFETDLLPPGVLPLNNVLDSGARLIFVEDLLPESGGSAFNTNIQGGNFLGRYFGPGAILVPVPVGSTTLGVTITSAPGCRVFIYGVATELIYLDRTPGVSDYSVVQYFIPIQPIDRNIVISIDPAGGNVYLYAFSAIQAVRISQNLGDVLNVSSGNNPLTVIPDPNASFVQVPNMAIVRFTQAMAAGGNVIIIPNIVGKAIKLYGGSISSDVANASISLLNDGGSYLLEYSGLNINVNNIIDLKGYSILGSSIHLYSFAAATLRGTLSYTQI